MSIVQFAEAEAATDEYDRVYCVFDRDGHANYDQALQRIRQLDGFYAIPSWPCFEIWILLHFHYSTAPFQADGGRSSCENVIREIHQHFARYTKGSATVFDDLASRLVDALRHAQQLRRHNTQSGSVNPDTKIHQLVRYLINLRR